MEPMDFIVQSLNMAQESLTRSLQDLTPYEVAWRPSPESNSVGFILWHMTRSEDSLVNGLFRGGKPQLWETGRWGEKLGLNPDPKNSGNGYTREQLGGFATPELSKLVEYHQAVRANTLEYLKNLKPADLEAELTFFGGRKMPLKNMLSLLLSEILTHSGQIAYLRGMSKGLNK